MRKHLYFWHYALFIIISIAMLGVLVSYRPVDANFQTTVSIQPVSSIVYLNGTKDIQFQVYVSNVVDLNAFDIAVTFDPDLVNLTNVSNGNFLKNLFCFPDVINSGYISRACTQINSPGVSGEGVLINLSFTGINTGEGLIRIDRAELSNKANELILAQKQHGSLSVGYHTTPVLGAISLQGQAVRAGVPGSLGTGAVYGQGPFNVLSLPILGANLDFGPIVRCDTYTLIVNPPGYLTLSSTLAVGVDPVSLPPLRLLAGDITGDQAVTMADLDAIRAAFGSRGAGLAADLNDDGVVDLRDLALAGGNFGLTAQEAYADWLP